MQRSRVARLQRVLAVAVVVLILKVTASVMLGYRDYFPANFDNDFLSGRESYFAGGYQWAFYAHIVSGPISLVLALLLVSESFRLRFPVWHRSLGKAQVATVLVLLAPSGLWMAWYARTGPIAGMGFAVLAFATGVCVLMGWRMAVQRRFVEHRRWTWRCFWLLCSAVIVRVIGGLATVLLWGDAWIYPLTAWCSWLVPLTAFELLAVIRRRCRQAEIRSERCRAPSITLSPHAVEAVVQ